MNCIEIVDSERIYPFPDDRFIIRVQMTIKNHKIDRLRHHFCTVFYIKTQDYAFVYSPDGITMKRVTEVHGSIKDAESFAWIILRGFCQDIILGIRNWWTGKERKQ